MTKLVKTYTGGVRYMTQQLSPWEEAYHDWRDLLDRAGASDLIHDPKAVWDEAWRQALLRSLTVIEKDVATTDEIRNNIQELMKC